VLSPEEKSLQDAASLLQSHCKYGCTATAKSLHHHCKKLAAPLQQACNVTATGLQRNCNECAAEQIEKVMKHHPCQQSMFCNPNAVISFLCIDYARQYKKFIPIIGSYPK